MPHFSLISPVQSFTFEIVLAYMPHFSDRDLSSLDKCALLLYS